MDRLHGTDEQIGTRSRFAGYDRIMGSISWLLIALVALHIKLLPPDDHGVLPLALLCLLLFVYNVAARYLAPSHLSGHTKTFIDLMVFLFFTVGICWFSGRDSSPFVSLIYLVLMATALTQGKRVTYFMAALAVTSYIYLATGNLSGWLEEYRSLANLLQLFPFMLIAHLGAMLAGEAESAREEVERLSLTDEVTGLHNMRNFENLALIQESLAQRYQKAFVVCMLDADNLKRINDRHGHLAGTALIRHVADIVRQHVRASDIAARYGGDEFIILFNEATVDNARVPVERIVKALAETPFIVGGVELRSTLSAGIAAFPGDGNDLRGVMAKADEAMYTSKRLGKNRLTIFGREHQTP